MSTVAATTKEIKTSTRYTYDFTHLPPLAMVGAVTEAEAFSAWPDWIRLAARPALKILINSIMIGVKDKGDKVEFVQQVLKKVQAIAQQLKGDAGRDLSNAIGSELDKQGSPTTLLQLKALLEGVIEPLAQTLPLNTLLETVSHRRFRRALTFESNDKVTELLSRVLQRHGRLDHPQDGIRNINKGRD